MEKEQLISKLKLHTFDVSEFESLDGTEISEIFYKELGVTPQKLTFLMTIPSNKHDEANNDVNVAFIDDLVVFTGVHSSLDGYPISFSVDKIMTIDEFNAEGNALKEKDIAKALLIALNENFCYASL